MKSFPDHRALDGDGGVYHKLTRENFSGFVMPQNDNATRYFVGTGSSPFKGTCATADFAAAACRTAAEEAFVAQPRRQACLWVARAS